MKIFSVILIILAFFPIWGTDVFINGIKVTGIKENELKNCNIKIDKDGNIHIDAPDVKIVEESKSVSKEYFLSISFEKSLPVDFSIIINGKEVSILKKGEKDSILELNKFIKKGENIVSFTSVPATEVVKFTLVAGTGVKKESNIEFSPILEHKGEINNLGSAGNFKITAE